MADKFERAFADALRQAIAKQTTPPPQRGVVDDVDTTQRSAVVLVGSKRVTATYWGRIPKVSDRVLVSQDGAVWSIISFADPDVREGGSGVLALPPISAPGNIGRLTIWGHSWGDTVVDNTFATRRVSESRFGERLAGMAGLDWPNYRNRSVTGESLLVNGFAAIQNGVTPDLPSEAPYVSMSGAHVIVTGLNDIGAFGPFSVQLLEAWRNAWRSSIARLWAGGYFEPLDATWAYSGTQENLDALPTPIPGTWFRVACPWNAGRAIRATTTTGAVATWNVPADHSGGFVNVRLVGEHQGVQAGATVVTITAPPAQAGGAAQVFTRATHNAMTGRSSTVNVRIFLPATGSAQSITVAATTLAGGGRLAVDCAEIEDSAPPRIVAMTVAPPFDWAIYGAQNAGTIVPARTGTGPPLGDQVPDAWLVEPNSATTAVFAEFGSPANLLLLDQSLVMDGRIYPDRYMDQSHPNALGDIALAQAIYDGFGLLNASSVTTSTTAGAPGGQPSTPHNPDALALWAVFMGGD